MQWVSRMQASYFRFVLKNKIQQNSKATTTYTSTSDRRRRKWLRKLTRLVIFGYFCLTKTNSGRSSLSHTPKQQISPHVYILLVYILRVTCGEICCLIRPLADAIGAAVAWPFRRTGEVNRWILKHRSTVILHRDRSHRSHCCSHRELQGGPKSGIPTLILR